VRSKDRAEYFVDHSITRSIKSASIDRIDRSLDQSIESINHSINHSIDQSLDRSLDRSIDRSITRFDSIRFRFGRHGSREKSRRFARPRDGARARANDHREARDDDGGCVDVVIDS